MPQLVREWDNTGSPQIILINRHEPMASCPEVMGLLSLGLSTIKRTTDSQIKLDWADSVTLTLGRLQLDNMQ